MNITLLCRAALAVLVSIFVYSIPAHAQENVTWVSGVGDDANPCSRTDPCKTFAGAISKTAAGGQISVLDSGGFGAVTITKSISIIAEGAQGSILSASANGITINAGASDVVHIHGLFIEGYGGMQTGLSGIRVLSAKSVYISKMVIRDVLGASPNGCGVSLLSAINPVRMYLRDVQLNNNRVGVCVTSNAGVLNAAFIERSSIEGNVANSLALNGANASATVFDSVLTATPVSLLAGATFGSAGNNRIAGAVAPTVIVPLQ